MCDNVITDFKSEAKLCKMQMPLNSAFYAGCYRGEYWVTDI